MAAGPFLGTSTCPLPLEPGALEDCAAHASHVQSAISVPLLLENPFILAPRGNMHVLDFMAELHRRTGCGLLLDLAHLLAHQWAYGLSLEDGLDRFPLDKVVQLHIAGGGRGLGIRRLASLSMIIPSRSVKRSSSFWRRSFRAAVLFGR